MDFSPHLAGIAAAVAVKAETFKTQPFRLFSAFAFIESLVREAVGQAVAASAANDAGGEERAPAQANSPPLTTDRSLCPLAEARAFAEAAGNKAFTAAWGAMPLMLRTAIGWYVAPHATALINDIIDDAFAALTPRPAAVAGGLAQRPCCQRRPRHAAPSHAGGPAMMLFATAGPHPALWVIFACLAILAVIAWYAVNYPNEAKTVSTAASSITTTLPASPLTPDEHEPPIELIPAVHHDRLAAVMERLAKQLEKCDAETKPPAALDPQAEQQRLRAEARARRVVAFDNLLRLQDVLIEDCGSPSEEVLRLAQDAAQRLSKGIMNMGAA